MISQIKKDDYCGLIDPSPSNEGAFKACINKDPEEAEGEFEGCKDAVCDLFGYNQTLAKEIACDELRNFAEYCNDISENVDGYTDEAGCPGMSQ